jgi:hypothetical protein
MRPEEWGGENHAVHDEGGHRRKHKNDFGHALPETNWGYAICDAAMRTHVVTGAPAPTFPYPASGVGS